MVMVLRVLHAAAPSVRSSRLPLAHVLSRDLGYVQSNGAFSAYGA
jgi:hypothetical protein